MPDVKKLVRGTTKIEMLCDGFLSRFQAGDAPGPQDLIEYKLGEIIEVERSTSTVNPKGEKVLIGGMAENLVRSKRAKFIDQKEAKEFVEAEKKRLGPELYARMQALPMSNPITRTYLSDAEWKEAQRLARGDDRRADAEQLIKS